MADHKPTPPTQTGQAAETLACSYLEAQGLRPLLRNFRCRVGELDLIMQDGDYLVFVEVRSRHNRRYGTPAETVTVTKQRRLIKAATYYLQQSRCRAPCRFDVVAVVRDREQTTVEWIRDAFQVS